MTPLFNTVTCVLLSLSGIISESLVHVTVVAGPPVEIQVSTASLILYLDSNMEMFPIQIKW